MTTPLVRIVDRSAEALAGADLETGVETILELPVW